MTKRTMSKKGKKLVIGVTGASGAIYAKVLFDRLQELKDQVAEVGVVFSSNAREVWKLELGNSEFEKLPFTIYDSNDFMAPFASGSAKYETMIICPCSMGTMARIASGVSNDLMTRAADVILKERRKLILVARDTPLSLIHINSPSFYSHPIDFDALAKTVVDRVLDLAGFELDSYRWNS